jgi:hypothetical protein
MLNQLDLINEALEDSCSLIEMKSILEELLEIIDQEIKKEE